MHDFTPEQYSALLSALTRSGIAFRLIHDIDKRPSNALHVARQEARIGIASTYYFRSHQFVSHADTIRAVADLGHTIGYHYENLATAHGDFAQAYDSFCRHLEALRQIAPVSTACAHGSPHSPWNNRDLWQHYDIHALGITYEPLLNTDFTTTLYLTDTGHRWDGFRVSVRDKVVAQHEQWVSEGLVFHSTDDIIRALSTPSHPIHRYHLLINIHPQRWMPFGPQWVAEACMQYVKNGVKRLLVAARR